MLALRSSGQSVNHQHTGKSQNITLIQTASKHGDLSYFERWDGHESTRRNTEERWTLVQATAGKELVTVSCLVWTCLDVRADEFLIVLSGGSFLDRYLRLGGDLFDECTDGLH